MYEVNQKESICLLGNAQYHILENTVCVMFRVGILCESLAGQSVWDVSSFQTTSSSPGPLAEGLRIR